MTIIQYLVTTIMATSVIAGIACAQDENDENANKEQPIVDEFSLVMRNLLNRAHPKPADEKATVPTHKLEAKVDEIQSLLNKSDKQVARASKLKVISSLHQSENKQSQEIEKMKLKLAAEAERQLAQLTITKAKIASIKKSVKDEKQRKALDRADKAVQAALKLIAGKEE